MDKDLCEICGSRQNLLDQYTTGLPEFVNHGCNFIKDSDVIFTVKQKFVRTICAKCAGETNASI